MLSDEALTQFCIFSLSYFPHSRLPQAESNIHLQCWPQHKPMYGSSIQSFCFEDTGRGLEKLLPGTQAALVLRVEV